MNPFFYLTAVIGLSLIGIGIAAVLWPQPMAKAFGIAVGNEALPYVISTGIRDFALGSIVLIFFYYEAWAEIGSICFCIAIIAVSDFFSVRTYGDKRISFVHLAGAISLIVYGTWLVSQ